MLYNLATAAGYAIFDLKDSKSTPEMSGLGGSSYCCLISKAFSQDGASHDSIYEYAAGLGGTKAHI